MADAPRLFLITPPIADPESFVPLLRAALGAADIACLLIRTAARDEHGVKAIVRALAPIAQAEDVAVLIEDPRLAGRLDVDGVHIESLHIADAGDALDDALRALKPRKIVGIGRLAGRDAAMAAGERGVDYLMFGSPGSGEPDEAIRDKVAWWAAIFNVPCVGYASDPGFAPEIAAAGAEFIGLSEGLWDHPDRIAETLAQVQRNVQRDVHRAAQSEATA